MIWNDEPLSSYQAAVVFVAHKRISNNKTDNNINSGNTHIHALLSARIYLVLLLLLLASQYTWPIVNPNRMYPLWVCVCVGLCKLYGPFAQVACFCHISLTCALANQTKPQVSARGRWALSSTPTNIQWESSTTCQLLTSSLPLVVAL